MLGPLTARVLLTPPTHTLPYFRFLPTGFWEVWGPSLIAGRNNLVASPSSFQEWVSIWNNETHGAYRADICRLAALIKHGGVYLDDDVELFKKPWGLAIRADTTFMSVAEFPRQELPPGLFQAVIGSTQVFWCTPRSYTPMCIGVGAAAAVLLLINPIAPAAQSKFKC